MDYTMLIMLALFGVLLIFMFRSNKKRQQQAQELQNSLVSGVEVMTTTGIYGTVTLVDDQENIIWVESTPGTIIRVHRQAIAKVITPLAEEPESSEPTTLLNGEPEFGQRNDPNDESGKK